MLRKKSKNEIFARNLRHIRTQIRKDEGLRTLSMREMAKRYNISGDSYRRWENMGWVPYANNLDFIVGYLRSRGYRITRNKLLTEDLSVSTMVREPSAAYITLPEFIKRIPRYSLKDDIPGTPTRYLHCDKDMLKRADFIVDVVDNKLQSMGIQKGDILVTQEGYVSPNGLFIVREENKNRIQRLYSLEKMFTIVDGVPTPISEDIEIVGQVLLIIKMQQP